MCKWYEFHDWKQIKENIIYTFMKEECSKLVGSIYRKCYKCGEIQEVHMTMESYYNETVSNCEKTILDKTIVFSDLNDCYIFRDSKDRTQKDLK